jgi:hypothetical protein
MKLVKLLAVAIAVVWFVAACMETPTASAHLPHPTPLSLQEAKWNLAHARKAHPAAVPWLRGVVSRKQVRSVSYWAALQIHYATLIARSSSKDPWPNCPDPFDGRGSWFDTVSCENHGNWLDSPGYYRCGLQFDPGWERHYGRKFCP